MEHSSQRINRNKMYRYIVLIVFLLQLMKPFSLVSGIMHSTLVEYKETDDVPNHLQSELEPFKLIGQQYYFIANESVNWFQSIQECRKLGANLISLTTEEERQLIGLHLMQNYTYWVDISNLGQDNNVSITTGLEAIEMKWLPQDVEDRDADDEEMNCVVLSYDDEDGFLMKKSKCLDKTRFICELATPKTISIVIW